MSRGELNPPKLALWLLQHACPGNHDQVLTGDILEKFRVGQSRSWFWKEALIAITVGIVAEFRQHWPHFSYAIAGTAMPKFCARVTACRQRGCASSAQALKSGSSSRFGKSARR